MTTLVIKRAVFGTPFAMIVAAFAVASCETTGLEDSQGVDAPQYSDAASKDAVTASIASAAGGEYFDLDRMPDAVFNEMFDSNRLVGSPGLSWKKRRVLRVAFHGGSEAAYRLIEDAAMEWTRIGGELAFDFKSADGTYHRWSPADTQADADIRISFGAGGYWSRLGVLATNATPQQMTMNLERFDTRLPAYSGDAEAWRVSYERLTVMHEFGHALGLSHEHFNPQCQNDLKIAEIVNFLQGPPNGWSPQQAQFNIDAEYYKKILGRQAGKFESKLLTSPNADQSSVMLYVLPVRYYRSGDLSVCKAKGDSGVTWPTTLSAGDRQFYLDNYGKIDTPF